MAKIKDFLKSNRPVVVLMGILLVLTSIPVLDAYTVVGDAWRGVTPTFGDELFYLARIETVVKGHVSAGNPYFIEHSDGPPLVTFAGVWINAIPQLAGLPLNAALVFNFILWSLLFGVSAYWLFRELRVRPWIAVAGVVLLYLQSYVHVWRPVNLQTVFPFYFLFYTALLRLIREQTRKNVVLLALVTGATFYLFAYLWQTIAITLGLLSLWALFSKNWRLLKATLLSSLVGGIIGLPPLLYALWLSHASPNFWESVGRLGLVNTHVPMAEVIYSGGWIGIALALLAILWFRVPTFRQDKEFIFLELFLIIGGLGLWIMQGSNLLTGKLLETGEHVRLLIQPWLVISLVSIGVYLWPRRALVSNGLKIVSLGALGALLFVSANYTHERLAPIFPSNIDHALWQTQQLYSKPFAWLEEHEKTPVVIWANPYGNLVNYLPVFTKHFLLYNWSGMMELVPEAEIRERYLISEYFDNPTIADLMSEEGMRMYLGRHDFPHAAKTIEREIKVCRILFIFDKAKDCGIVPTPQSLLGEEFFSTLEKKFRQDIRPNIKNYLTKYQVTYILKDTVLDPQYHPETLGAKRVYKDERYEIWQL